MKALLTIDLEEFVYPFEQGIQFERSRAFEISYEGLMLLLKHIRIPMTFFSTIEFMERYPETIKYLMKKHEIAIHGVTHAKPFEKLKEKKQEMEKRFNYKFHGFRTPRFGRTDFGLLRECNFVYDSSVHPRLFAKISKNKAIIEVPVSAPYKIPISWVWFRNYPLWLTKSLSKGSYIMLYFHPYDFYDLSRFNLPWYYKRNTGIKAVLKLKKYLNSLNAEFTTVYNYVINQRRA